MTPAAKRRKSSARERDLRSMVVAALAGAGWDRPAMARIARAVLAEQGRGAPADAKAALDALRLAVNDPGPSGEGAK